MDALTILEMDEHLVAVDKPAGMLVHPAGEETGPEWVVMKRLRDQLGMPVYPVHRLDRPTTGVLLFALNLQSQAELQRQFAKRVVKKIYEAVVFGSCAESWCCESSLDAGEGTSPKPARTDFRRLEVRSEPDLARVEAHPETGRYHQIRRHLLEAGHPIVGDYRYAGVEACDEMGERFGISSRMLLHARELELSHPVTAAWMRILAPLPVEWMKVFPKVSGA